MDEWIQPSPQACFQRYASPSSMHNFICCSFWQVGLRFYQRASDQNKTSDRCLVHTSHSFHSYLPIVDLTPSRVFFKTSTVCKRSFFFFFDTKVCKRSHLFSSSSHCILLTSFFLRFSIFVFSRLEVQLFNFVPCLAEDFAPCFFCQWKTFPP